MTRGPTTEEMLSRDSAAPLASGTDRVRSRKETLSSPIPALLATSMGDVEEPPVDVQSIPVFVNSCETSRLDVSVRQALLAEKSEKAAEEAIDDLYVIEVDPLAR
jgi:hypothetical protein